MSVNHASQLNGAVGSAHERSGVNFWGVLLSEWLKISSLRSTWWSLGTILVVGFGLSFLMAFSIGLGSEMAPVPEEFGPPMSVMVATFPLSMTTLGAAVLGVLVITGEYSTGLIRSTFAAVPKRLPAFLAKGAQLFLVLLVVGWVTTLGGFFLTAGVRESSGIGASITEEGVLPALLSGGLVLALLGLMSFGIGGMLRNAGGGIATSIAVLMVLPIVTSILQQFEWAKDLVNYLPTSAGTVMYTPSSEFFGAGEPVMEYWQALAILLAWTFAMLIPATILVKIRDV